MDVPAGQQQWAYFVCRSKWVSGAVGISIRRVLGGAVDEPRSVGITVSLGARDGP